MHDMMTTAMSAAANNDADLVAASLSGNRDAFGHIVSRYQSLICSLAYSATGSLGASEDLAQETFITAWKHLRQLRERNKLRAWLCGIARNRINNCLRREGREPAHIAEQLEEARIKNDAGGIAVRKPYKLPRAERAGRNSSVVRCRIGCCRRPDAGAMRQTIAAFSKDGKTFDSDRRGRRKKPSADEGRARASGLCGDGNRSG